MSISTALFLFFSSSLFSVALFFCFTVLLFLFSSVSLFLCFSVHLFACSSSPLLFSFNPLCSLLILNHRSIPLVEFTRLSKFIPLSLLLLLLPIQKHIRPCSSSFGYTSSSKRNQESEKVSHLVLGIKASDRY